MVWIIASVPFWMIGISMLILVIIGCCQWVSAMPSKDTPKDSIDLIVGMSALLIVSGSFLMVAAKLCS